MSEIFLKLKTLFLSKEFLRFFIVGVSATVLDFSILFFQISVLKSNPFLQFNVGGVVLNISVANAISALIAIIFSFIAQRLWTFDAKGTKIGNQALKYAIVVAFTYAYTNILFGSFVKDFGITELISKLIVTAMQMVTSYILYKFFVFKK